MVWHSRIDAQEHHTVRRRHPERPLRQRRPLRRYDNVFRRRRPHAEVDRRPRTIREENRNNRTTRA